MLEACGAANARRPWRKPQCIELSADEAAEARTDSNSSDETAVARLVRVPNNLLGTLLDHGRAGAYALHLIAFKLLHGAGWAISEGQVAKPPNQGGIGMGERKLRKGLALAKAQGVLDRRIGGRRPNGRAAFARERLAAGSGRYIELPETLIRSSDSKLLAFVAAILLAPFPQDARDNAERIGLSRRSPNAIKRLVKTATADHHIAAEHVGRHWIVARPGVNLAVFQNVAIQNVVIQNVAIHSLLEDDHRKQEDDHKKQQAKRVTPQPPSPAEAPPLRCDDVDAVDAAWLSKRLLGWLADDAEPFTADILEVDSAAIEPVLPDETLAELIRSAAGDRAHPEIVSPGGLYAIRHLTAYVREKVAIEQGEEIAAHSALMVVMRPICAVRDSGGWLNSLKVVGLRLAGDTCNPAAPATAYFAGLRAADPAKVLAPHVFGKGKGSLTRLLNEFGSAETLDTIKAVLTRAMIDGMAPGSVTTWSYFRPALLEQQTAEAMAAAGLRPGDVFGAHRAWAQ